MNHKNYLMNGIAILFVLLIGGAGITYIFLTHQPIVATKPLTKVQKPSKSIKHLEKALTPVHAKTTTKDPLGHSQHQAKKVEKESESSIVHASTISMTSPTKPKVVNQVLSTQKKKEEKLTLADLQFGLSRTGLKTKTKATLDTYAKKLRDPQWSVLIQGHTDETGSIRKNLHVGLRRANVVKQYLITKGISKDRLHAVSLGEYKPVCTDTTPACQLKNRRVSFDVARLEGIKTQDVIPVTQKKIVPSEQYKNAGSIALVSIPEIYKATIDKPKKIGLVYPDPVHGTPPPSTSLSDDNS